MHINLSGRTALVTGSTAGIGLAIATALHDAGADIIINGRSAERVDATLSQLNQSPRAKGIVADVGTAEGCAALIKAKPEVDILINNAGIYAPQTVFDIPDSEWERFFAINVMSGIRLSRHYLPKMVAKGWGRAVFISSESGVQIPPEMVHYGMTKTAQIAVARGFAEAVSGSGVTVNTILPGPTLTEGVEKFLGDMMQQSSLTIEEAGRQFIQEHRPTSLLGRLASVEEVASLVTYLCSNQASATTGAAMRVEGGLLRGLL